MNPQVCCIVIMISFSPSSFLLQVLQPKFPRGDEL